MPVLSMPILTRLSSICSKQVFACSSSYENKHRFKAGYHINRCMYVLNLNLISSLYYRLIPTLIFLIIPLCVFQFLNYCIHIEWPGDHFSHTCVAQSIFIGLDKVSIQKICCVNFVAKHVLWVLAH